jgi:radical SAM superfamily enzyme YgiQ (UPF0313 family)
MNYFHPVETYFPHLGLGYIASSLRQEMPVTFRIGLGHVKEWVSGWEPDIIGITSVSQYYGQAMQLANLVKHYTNSPVIMGGIHISALPQTLTKDMDVGILGEGEQTIVDLVRRLSSEGKLTNLEEVDGIAYHKDGQVVTTKLGEMIKDLDTLPFPARDILAVHPHTDMFKSLPRATEIIRAHTSMFSSRGCPYKCFFCASSRFWNKVRFFSAEYVVAEIEHLYLQYGVNKISFLDDLFIADKKRLIEIVELLGKRNLLGKIPFICNVRSNLVNDDLCRILKELGVVLVGMGLESGCQSTLDYLKGNVTIEQHTQALATLRHHGIPVNPSFIIGSPYEERDDIRQTIKFIKDNHIHFFEVYALTPFPGTPVWEYAKGRGLVSEDMDWSRLDVHNFDSRSVVVSEKLAFDELDHFYRQMRKIRDGRLFRSMLMKGILSPWRIPEYLRRKFLSGKG